MQGNSNSGLGLEPLYHSATQSRKVIGGWESAKSAKSPEKAVVKAESWKLLLRCCCCSFHFRHFSTPSKSPCHLFKSLLSSLRKKAIRSFGNAWPFAGRISFLLFSKKKQFLKLVMLVSWGGPLLLSNLVKYGFWGFCLGSQGLLLTVPGCLEPVIGLVDTGASHTAGNQWGTESAVIWCRIPMLPILYLLQTHYIHDQKNI